MSAPQVKQSRWQDVGGLAKDTITAWRRDNASRLAAALAYYTLLSLAPLLILLIVVAGQIFGEEAARGEVALRLRLIFGFDRLGSNTAEFVQSVIETAGREQTSGLVATVVSLLALLWSASQSFNQLQGALDAVWHVRPAEGRGLLHVIKDRFTAFVMVLLLGALLLLTFALSTGLAAANRLLPVYARPNLNLSPLFNLLLSFLVITAAFTIIYKVLPNVHISWRTSLIGGVATALLFSVGNFLIGLYLNYSSVGSTYGAAGSFLVILVWIYYSAQVVLLGAEFTKIYAARYKRMARPEADAIFYRIVESGEPTLRTVAATVPEPEVQVLARSLEEPVAAADPVALPAVESVLAVPRTETGSARSPYSWLLAAVGIFILGLLIGRRE